MKEKWWGLNIFTKTSLLAGFFVLAIFIFTIPFFFFDLREIPLGILLGGIVGIIPEIVFALSEKKESEKGKLIISIITTIFRFLLIVGILFLCAYLYYSLGLRLFNVFAVFGAYFIPAICLLTLYISRKGQENV